MSFASGNVSFQRFNVIGSAPSVPTTELLGKIEDHKFAIGDIIEATEYGWSAGRHLFDADFSFDNNVFGEAIQFGLRIDTNIIPGSVKKSWEQMEQAEVAKGNPSGFISKLQKKEVKNTIRLKVEAEQKSGKFRRSKMIQILWDLKNHVVYANAGGKSFEILAEIFERTFELQLAPVNAGSSAYRYVDRKGDKELFAALESARPTKFGGLDDVLVVPEYPWVTKQTEPKNFLGNEFLLWLWFRSEENDGLLQTCKEPGSFSEITVFMNKVLSLACSFGQTGKDQFHDDGFSRSPEVKEALRVGKVPRKAGFTFVVAKSDYFATFNPETFAFSGAKLPDVEEAETPRVLFEERINLLSDMCQVVDVLFETFLVERLGPAWDTVTREIRAWIEPKPHTSSADGAQW